MEMIVPFNMNNNNINNIHIGVGDERNGFNLLQMWMMNW